jgi:hypothetical protein
MQQIAITTASNKHLINLRTSHKVIQSRVSDPGSTVIIDQTSCSFKADCERQSTITTTAPDTRMTHRIHTLEALEVLVWIGFGIQRRRRSGTSLSKTGRARTKRMICQTKMHRAPLRFSYRPSTLTTLPIRLRFRSPKTTLSRS